MPGQRRRFQNGTAAAKCGTEGILLSFRIPSEKCSTQYQNISDHAHRIGVLGEEEKTPQCRKEDLGIVKDRDLFRGSERVGFRDGELSDRRADAREDQAKKLFWLQRLKIEEHARKTGQERENGEE